MKVELTREEMAALAVLKSAGEDLMEVAIIAKEAMEAGRGKPKRARRCIAAGAEELKKQEHTVTFEKAVAFALEARLERRVRTVYDFRYFTRRFMKRCPGLARRKVRSITPQECAQYIEMAFDTPRQRQKARLILSGVFGTAVKRGWCSENPVSKVETPRVVEKEIVPLKPEEVRRLEQAAQLPEHRDMQLSLHLMLYSGVRPAEVCRLSIRHIRLNEGRVIIPAQSSKTGGGRVIPLRSNKKLQGIPLSIPRNWQKRWQALRRAAGFTHWQPDVCRHTFASYHAAYFKDLGALQLEMGHRSTELLRTRYLNLPQVRQAQVFWG